MTSGTGPSGSLLEAESSEQLAGIGSQLGGRTPATPSPQPTASLTDRAFDVTIPLPPPDAGPGAVPVPPAFELRITGRTNVRAQVTLSYFMQEELLRPPLRTCPRPPIPGAPVCPFFREPFHWDPPAAQPPQWVAEALEELVQTFDEDVRPPGTERYVPAPHWGVPPGGATPGYWTLPQDEMVRANIAGIDLNVPPDVYYSYASMPDLGEFLTGNAPVPGTWDKAMNFVAGYGPENLPDLAHFGDVLYSLLAGLLSGQSPPDFRDYVGPIPGGDGFKPYYFVRGGDEAQRIRNRDNWSEVDWKRCHWRRCGPPVSQAVEVPHPWLELTIRYPVSPAVTLDVERFGTTTAFELPQVAEYAAWLFRWFSPETYWKASGELDALEAQLCTVGSARIAQALEALWSNVRAAVQGHFAAPAVRDFGPALRPYDELRQALREALSQAGFPADHELLQALDGLPDLLPRCQARLAPLDAEVASLLDPAATHGPDAPLTVGRSRLQAVLRGPLSLHALYPALRAVVERALRGEGSLSFAALRDHHAATGHDCVSYALTLGALLRGSSRLAARPLDDPRATFLGAVAPVLGQTWSDASLRAFLEPSVVRCLQELVRDGGDGCTTVCREALTALATALAPHWSEAWPWLRSLVQLTSELWEGASGSGLEVTVCQAVAARLRGGS